MNPQTDHNKIIKKIARQRLHPHGIMQKGNSRVFLYDAGWYTIMVEFQPGWNKGTYLNIGLDFHFYPSENIGFSYGSRERGIEIFEDEASFSAIMEELCTFTIGKVDSVKTDFHDVHAALKTIGNEHDWNIYHLYDKMVLFLLVDNIKMANAEYAKLQELPLHASWQHEVKNQAAIIMNWLEQPGEIKRKMLDRIHEVRTMKKLPPVQLEFMAGTFMRRD